MKMASDSGSPAAARNSCRNSPLVSTGLTPMLLKHTARIQALTPAFFSSVCSHNT